MLQYCNKVHKRPDQKFQETRRDPTKISSSVYIYVTSYYSEIYSFHLDGKIWG